MSCLLRTSYPERFLFSAVKSCATPMSTAGRPAAPPTLLTPSPQRTPLIRTLSTSPSSLQPHFTPSLLQQQQQDKASSPPPPVEARPYSEIPRTKTFLGLNWGMLKDPTRVAEFMREQGDELGSIFRIAGVPGLPEMVCIFDPKDVETAFRVGDSAYPRRFPIKEWTEARKELKHPTGLFLE